MKLIEEINTQLEIYKKTHAQIQLESPEKYEFVELFKVTEFYNDLIVQRTRDFHSHYQSIQILIEDETVFDVYYSYHAFSGSDHTEVKFGDQIISLTKADSDFEIKKEIVVNEINRILNKEDYVKIAPVVKKKEH